MNFTPLLIILTACSQAPTTGASQNRYAEAVPIFVCNFEHSSNPEMDTDVNYDRWPDFWTRRRDRKHPSYIRVQIDPTTDGSNHHLALELDGGAAEVSSPRMSVSPMFSYVLEARIRTESLIHNVAYASIRFYDKEKNVVASFVSEPFKGSTEWTDLRIGPVTPESKDIFEAEIHLHLHPEDEEHFDLRGSASFDEIWFARLPRMDVTANLDTHVFSSPEEIELTCRVAGVKKSHLRVRFELLDAIGGRLAEEHVLLKIQKTVESSEDGLGDSVEAVGKWRPPIPPQAYGFYQARASLDGDAGSPLKRTISLVMARPHPGLAQGEFGWSVPADNNPLDLRQLAILLSQVGVNWVKYPVWIDDRDVDIADRLAWFSERMSTSNIHLVGVLDKPPTPKGQESKDQSAPPIALLFGDAGIWKPLVNPVMTRLSLKVRWWQLGADDDLSFVGFPGLESKVMEIREHLERFGQEVRIGVNWRWISDLPAIAEPPWQFLSYNIDPPFTDRELAEALAAEERPNWSRWAMLRPLAIDRYTLETRVRDLVLRMLAGKINGADAIFAPNPFHETTGLMNPDGTPGPLLLPWRTTSLMTSGAEYIGRIEMPNKSSNYVFGRDNDEGVMVVWSDRPTQEVLYLGEPEELRIIDIWGRETKPEVRTDSNGVRRQIVPVGTLPKFITGVNLPVAKWRMNFRFSREQLLSTFGVSQDAAYTFRNSFGQAISGRVRLNTPEVWEVSPQDVTFTMQENGVREQVFGVKLRLDANSGEQPIRVDFDIAAGRQYRFSVYRSMQVGLGDVVIEFETRFAPNGMDLIVNLVLTNSADSRARFNCFLMHPNRKRQRLQITSNGRGRTSAQFMIRNGRELINQDLFVRAEEIGGIRVLNYRVSVHE